MRRGVLVAVVLAGGCAGPDPADHCPVVSRSFAISVQQRAVIGEASPYPADRMLRARQDELDRSQRARRDAAWEVIARMTEPVPISVDLAAHEGPDELPRWHTWYVRNDLVRVFQKAFRPLPQADRLARGPIPDDVLDAAFAWNPTAIEEDEAWTEERWLDYLASLDTQEEVDGLGERIRTAYAPGAARHFLASYGELIGCFEDGPPDAFVDGTPVQPVLDREALVLAACEERVFGPYFIASGERISAYADARITITRDTPDGRIACEADASPCEAQGPGTLWVTVAADGAPIDDTLYVEHTAPDAPWAGCLRGRFPTDAAVIKADWRRVGLDFQVPVHDTSAAGLTAVGAGTVDGSWVEGVDVADPGAETIHTITSAVGDRYRLVGLHMMTRELDHWLWTTMWWSPDPDTDFGADRPASIAGVWRNYKMCTASFFTEGDSDPTGGYADDHPDLAASLAAVHAGAGGPSWCSNPYIEAGHGNASTNCLGCHQHGGTELLAETILDSPSELPDSGRAQVRNNFPADYSWATVNGDELANMLREEVLYWDEVP